MTHCHVHRGPTIHSCEQCELLRVIVKGSLFHQNTVHTHMFIRKCEELELPFPPRPSWYSFTDPRMDGGLSWPRHVGLYVGLQASV